MFYVKFSVQEVLISLMYIPIHHFIYVVSSLDFYFIISIFLTRCDLLLIPCLNFNLLNSLNMHCQKRDLCSYVLYGVSKDLYSWHSDDPGIIIVSCCLPPWFPLTSLYYWRPGSRTIYSAHPQPCVELMVVYIIYQRNSKSATEREMSQSQNEM